MRKRKLFTYFVTKVGTIKSEATMKKIIDHNYVSIYEMFYTSHK